jgi:hypothetical protein
LADVPEFDDFGVLEAEDVDDDCAEGAWGGADFGMDGDQVDRGQRGLAVMGLLMAFAPP